jgi:hypothetical protein
MRLLLINGVSLILPDHSPLRMKTARSTRQLIASFNVHRHCDSPNPDLIKRNLKSSIASASLGS